MRNAKEQESFAAKNVGSNSMTKDFHPNVKSAERLSDREAQWQKLGEQFTAQWHAGIKLRKSLVS